MGHIYLIKLEEHDIYKIGIAKTEINLGQRMMMIQTGCPFKIQLFRLFQSEGYKMIEQMAHHKFRHCRTFGEWFRLDAEQIAELIEYLNNRTSGIELRVKTTSKYIKPIREERIIPIVEQAKEIKQEKPKVKHLTAEQSAYRASLFTS